MTFPSNELALRLYREMRTLRALDQRMIAAQRSGRIGFYGAATGQEAVPAAVGLALAPEDWVFPALREGGVMLVRGFPLSRYIAQLFGNDHDLLRGRQMPSHMSGRSVRQVSWSSCVGTQLPHAVGAAWAAKLRGDRLVSVGFLGDGATSTGDFHAALNFAAVFHVPCVFVCQNNRYAISVGVERQTAAESLSAKAEAYAVSSRQVDGNDVFAVFEAVAQARERALQGDGPSLLECLTYRLGPHSSSDDPSLYRSSDEERHWAQKDPIERARRELVSRGVLSEALDAGLSSEIDAAISAALAQAEAYGPPPVASLFADVYAEPPWHLNEQRKALARALGARGALG